jgi:HK97 family phage portal protein
MTSRPPRIRTSRIATRASYVRTNADLLLNEPDGFPSAFPAMWWVGSDTGAGSYPIGPAALGGPHTGRVQPATTRLISLITDPLSVVPWRQVQLGFNGDVLTTPRFLTDPQLLRPDNRYDTPALPAVQRLPRAEFFASWIRVAIIAGMAALIFIEDVDGQPLAGSLRVLNPFYVAPVRGETGALCWEIGDGADRIRSDREGYFQVGALTWRLVMLRDPHAPVDEDGRSISLFERHADTFGLSGQIEQYMAGVYRGDGVPSGLLRVNTPGLQQETADALQQAWMAAHGSRAGVAVLSSTVDFTPLSRSPVDVAAIEAKHANLADLAMCFSLDPGGALGISLGASNTYQNMQAWFARLRVDLMPWITAVEETISALLPAGRGVRMDFSEYTRPDPREQYAALQIAVDAGLLTLDEARNALGLPPLPEPPPAPPVPEPGPPPESATTAPVPDVPTSPASERHLRLQPWRR